MKIKNITMSTDLNDSTIDFINESMEKQSLNDVMLNNHHLLIHLDVNETFKPIQLLYRNLWQTAYLNDPSFIRYNHSIISISLSEAIGYINMATPPILKKDIPKQLSSIKAIIDIMSYLLNEDAQKEYNQSLFINYMKLDKFETVWNGRNDIVNEIRNTVDSKHPDQPLICIHDVKRHNISQIIMNGKLHNDIEEIVNTTIFTSYDILSIKISNNTSNMLFGEPMIWVKAFCQNRSEETTKRIESLTQKTIEYLS